jgi:two-component system, chemotaxis family, protein-glutamate methylesterase/glutaminase
MVDPRPPIRVLVVDDSAVIRESLAYGLTASPDIQVVGTAIDGEQAVALADRLRPDVITMDIHMPVMDGLTATRRIMETRPVPIIIVSGSPTAREVATTFHALEAGAVWFIPRPKGYGSPDYRHTTEELTRMVRLMAEVKVVRRWPKKVPGRNQEPVQPLIRTDARPEKRQAVELITMGCSTGGPQTLQTILSALRPDLPVPVLIVQHMSRGFVEGFAGWLSSTTKFSVSVGVHGDRCNAAHAYVAPDDCHLEISSEGTVILTKAPPENGVRPSVCRLFRSAAESFGGKAIGVLLTGMGSDGAKGLKALREKGGITIAQDEQSSIVYGMPAAAAELGAAVHVLPPEGIAAILNDLAGEP